MPKGYNKDGSKKTRPANSGRKAVESKAISPQISLEAAAVLAALKKQGKNLNRWISEAILEKAANDATRKAAPKSELNRPGQVDLVDMLQDIHLENVTSHIQQKAELEPMIDFSSMSLTDQIREREFMRQDQERADLDEWINMPAVETFNEIQRLLKHYNKKPQKSALFIQIRAVIPTEFFELKQAWRCWLEVTDEKGKLVDNYKQHASAYYVEQLFNRKDWKYVNGGGGLSFYVLPVGNAIKEKKPTVAKPKPVKATPKATNGTLMELLEDDNFTLPAWLQPTHTPAADLEPLEETVETEPGQTAEGTAWQDIILATEDNNPTPALFETTSEMSKPTYQEERKSKAYAMLLQEAFNGSARMSSEDLLAKIMRKRRKGKVDAIETLMVCTNLDLCTNNGEFVTLTKGAKTE